MENWRHNDASEVVLSDPTTQQLEDIRRRVRVSIDSIAAGECREYQGREELKKLADDVKAKGRKRLARRVSGR